MPDLNEKATFDHSSLKGAESTVEQQSHEESEATKKLLRKCDFRLIPPLMVIFFLSFMDRTNIGNAKIQGMTEDLKMTGSDYNMALFVFFIPYILFEVPSNIMIKKLSPSLWLSAITVLWGISTVGMGLVHNIQGLIACRALLGFFEAGITPGCIYLISMYYKRFEVQWRMSLFFSAAILAGAFSGLLAFAIARMHDVGGLEAWRWIFILEGILTVVVGVIAKWWIPDWPETAKFLSDDERSRLIARLADDSGDAKMNHLNKAAWKRILTDWKIYLGTLAYFGIVNNGYAGSFFIPTILREMGYAAERAQVLTIPVYIVATIGCLSAAYLADRLRHRYGFTMFGVVMTSIGYILLLLQHHVPTAARYFALFLLVTGGYITQPVILGWLSNTMGGHYKRSIASASQVGFGNLGGIVASNVYLTREAPEYWTGLGVSLGMVWICGISCTAFYFLAIRENKKRDRGERDHRLQGVDADNLGDDHPHWRDEGVDLNHYADSCDIAMSQLEHCKPFRDPLIYWLDSIQPLFPNPFNSSISMPGSVNSGLFSRLPGEVLNQIFDGLLNIDMKNLRQICSYLNAITHLQLGRVFLSPNPRDIETFTSIVDHALFRFNVTEICREGDNPFEEEENFELFSIIPEGVGRHWDGEERFKWHGFGVITKQVAQHIRENPMSNLSELVVESRQL
ncbi:tartrate transporter [Fusarium beomiforme]|uniref:Tartrate transporter n=1 Tax=Fusarium beomiforme TaxID=44412 RepID=A0A9P5DRD8_9HYPO|nr:tartrate transporter [Fusarium beomiforme]